VERHAKASLTDDVDQSPGGSSSLIKETQFWRQDFPALLAPVPGSIDLNSGWLHVQRRIGKKIRPFAVSMKQLVAVRTVGNGLIDDFRCDDQTPFSWLYIHRPHAGQVQKIKH
jgi:hypothetical protein